MFLELILMHIWERLEYLDWSIHMIWYHTKICCSSVHTPKYPMLLVNARRPVFQQFARVRSCTETRRSVPIVWPKFIWLQDRLYRIGLSTIHNEDVPPGNGPAIDQIGLTITKTGNVLVCCVAESKIKEYTTVRRVGERNKCWSKLYQKQPDTFLAWLTSQEIDIMPSRPSRAFQLSTWPLFVPS